MKKFLLVCFSFVFALSAWAQERVVSGKVTAAEDGSTLPGVNVVLKGTTNGTVTDIDGNYRLNVPSAGGTLVFSFIGLQTQELAIGERSIIDLQMGLDVRQLTEVVVTAQGIERERKALGFASTTISASDIANKPETDIGRALQGRTPGLQILSTSGLAGSGSKINIRGISSVTGDTQPLWVVDGVPINSATNNTNTDFQDGQVSPSRYLDIDPNNIESISVLRGLNATTLYGSLGRNGVILVTTKTGSGGNKDQKFTATVSQSVFNIEAVVPNYQNKWGNGFDGDYGEFFSNWGRVFDGQPPPNTPRHPYWEHRNLFPEFPEFQLDVGQGYVPEAQPNNVQDFFKDGTSSNTSLSIGSSTQFGSLNFSYSNLKETGFIKNNELRRNNFSFGGTAKLTDKLSISSTFNFVRTDVKTPPTGAGTGSNSSGGPSVFSNLFFTPRNININWPHQNPITGGSVYYRNGNDITHPRWLLDNSQTSSNTNRFFSAISFDYQLLDWLKATYRLGFDTYSENQAYWVNGGAVGFPGSISFLNTGLFRSTNVVNTVIDHSALLSVNKKLSSDIDLTGVLGFNARTDNFRQNGLESTNQVVFGLIEHRNFAQTRPQDFRNNQLNRTSRQTWVGAFFDAGIGYKNFLYLNVTGRNDWVSTLESDNRTLFYPGASAAFIPTAAFPGFAAGVLDFLKLRIGYGTSANFPGPFNTRPILNTNSSLTVDNIGNVAAQSLAGRLANPDLEPETQTEIEFGLEAQLLDNRAKIDFSYYDRSAEDQIIERDLDPSTGFLSTFINAGEITNHGVEIGLTITPIRTNSVVWNLRGNFTKNTSKVESLPDGSKEILVSGFTDLGNFAIEGEPFNVIQGRFAEKDADGNFLINENGDFVLSPEIGIIGDPNPDWLGSAISDVTWKGITFAFQFDYVKGGDVYSFTAATPVGRGVAAELESFNPGLPIIIPGVKESDGSVNDLAMPASGFFFGNTIIGSDAEDRGVFDGTRIRLREVSLSYSIPQSIISKLHIRNANISVVGNNLWWRALNAPEGSKADFDRTAFGTNNGAGFDFLGGPSARRYGATLRLTF